MILGVCAYSLDDQVAPVMPVDAGGIRGHIEAGDPNFYVSRGYVHVIMNVRGTGKSANHPRTIFTASVRARGAPVELAGVDLS